jgi:hypothetical protein
MIDRDIWAGISGSISLRSTEALRASAHPGNDPGRTLAHVLLEISQVGPLIWSPSLARWSPTEEECAVLDRLDDLQAEARQMIEAATGVSWDAIEGANL